MKYFLVIACALFLCTGCYDEDDIHVTEGLEMAYTLPQGEHDYDALIMDWYEQYGFYPLYIFEDRDIYWANTSWDERFEDGSGGTLQGTPANPDYVGEQLEMFNTGFMEIYPDSLIEKYMPLKLLLCSELWNVNLTRMYDPAAGGIVDKLIYTKLWARQGWNYIAINGGSEEMDTITPLYKAEFQSEVNAIFISRLYEEGVLEMPEEFGQVSDYTGSYLTGDTIFARGFLQDNPVPISSTLESMIESDFEAYLSLLSKPMSWLDTTPGPLYEYDYTGFARLVLKGVLQRDKNGLIRKKYGILMNMLKEKGIDIDRLQYPAF